MADMPFSDCNLGEEDCLLDIPEPCTTTTKNEQKPEKPINKKIRSLQDQNRYLRRKVTDLKQLVNNLRKGDLISDEAVDVVMVHLHYFLSIDSFIYS